MFLLVQLILDNVYLLNVELTLSLCRFLNVKTNFLSSIALTFYYNVKFEYKSGLTVTFFIDHDLKPNGFLTIALKF